MKRFRLLAALLAALLLLPLAPAALATVVTTEVSPLPWDDSPGYTPDPNGFSENGYFDESIRVEMSRVRRDEADYYVARVKIEHPSQIRTGLAKTTGSKTTTTTRMASAYHAVLAVNGDYYLDRKRGLTIRQGVTLRDTGSSQYDILLIDTDGNFHIVKRDNLDMLDFYLAGALTIQNAFSFGPALVMDGEKQEIPEKYSFAPHYRNPRAAIGQLGELEYAVVVVDGRQQDSAGATLETLAQFMFDLGCTQAFNLDGGNSATLVLGDTIYNNKSAANERSLSDILYFATSVDFGE